MTDLPDICKGCRMNYERFHASEKLKMSGMIKGCNYIDEIRQLERLADKNMIVRCGFKKGERE